MSRWCMGQTITTLQSLASRDWRGRCARPSRSIRARPMRCLRPRVRWAGRAPENEMTVFTIHQPAPRKTEDTAPPERFAFVRDGFYFWAFLLGPLWMFWNGLWLVLVLYLAGMAAIQAAL